MTSVQKSEFERQNVQVLFQKRTIAGNDEEHATAQKVTGDVVNPQFRHGSNEIRAESLWM